MTANKQYFHVVPFVILYKVLLTVKTLNITLVCDCLFVSLLINHPSLMTKGDFTILLCKIRIKA